MRIAVLGATGKTGNEVLTQALAAGHSVVAYVRRPDAVTPTAGLTVVGGQLDDVDAMTAAIDGCDVIVVTLGPKVQDRNQPLLSLAVPATIEAATKAGVKRIVVLSALGVGATYANTRYPYRLGARTFLKGNFIDHDTGESKLVDSGLHWTTVHPGPLFNGAPTPHPTVLDAATGIKMSGTPRTMRADVAAAIIGMLDDPTTYGKQILITSVQQKS